MTVNYKQIMININNDKVMKVMLHVKIVQRNRQRNPRKCTQIIT